jgi:hypothetical protein
MHPTLVQVPPGAGLPPARDQSSMHAVVKAQLRGANGRLVAAGTGADDD